MRRLELFVLAGLVFAGMTTATTETTASSSTQITGAGQRGVQAQSSSSASASESAQSSSRKGKGGGASTATIASASNSNSAAASAGPAAVQLNDGSAVNAVLVNSLDARKSKPGDKIEARTTSDVKQDGRVVLKKGSRLEGHVTEAQARSKENAFDSVTLKNGEQAPLHLRVQALRAASSETSAAMGNDEGTIASGASAGSGRVGGGLLGGAGAAVGGAAGAAGNVTGNAGRAAGGTVGATTHAAGSATSSAGGLDTAGHLTSSSSGVFGFEGLSLASAANSGTQASRASSKTQNVHLHSGTQMVLRASKP